MRITKFGSMAISRAKTLGFEKEIRALVMGGQGGIGDAIVEQLAASAQTTQLYATYRPGKAPPVGGRGAMTQWIPLDVADESSFVLAAETFRAANLDFNLVINCTGLLHGDGLDPERSWRHLDIETMTRVFSINTFAVALAVKHFLPLVNREERSVFASLSARVGSIEDNRLGGWYSYRASKAAQNMILRCAAIEAKRLRPALTCVALHPGTVKTTLSAPFTGRPGSRRVFSPEESARYLGQVIGGLTAEDSGGFFGWDGIRIEF